MERIFLITLYAVVFVTRTAIADDRPVIPPDVHYKFIDDKVDAEMRASLAAKFQQGEAEAVELFKLPCILAPGYWKSIAGSDCVQHRIPSTFSVPDAKTGVKVKLEGATTKDAEDWRRIAQRFAADVGKSPVIRRLTTDEVRLMWTVVPFDIEEPVYVLENGPHRFVIILMKDVGANTSCVWWVDDLAGYGKAN